MYKVLILKSAQKELAKLPSKEYFKIKTRISQLADDPRPAGSKKLTGRDAWRIRVGNYRIIYEINDGELVVLILKIRHRKDAYR